MKQNLQAVFILGMIFTFTNIFGQPTGLGSEKNKGGKKIETSYLDIVLNGVSTNLNYGSSNNDLKDYKKSILGLQAGLSFQAGITPKFSLVSELYFMMKGGKLKANNPAANNVTTLRFYTLELPVLARFHIGRLYVNAGPSIAYNLGGTNKIEHFRKAVAFNNSNEGFKHLDAGIQMGGGYELPLKQKRVAIDFRYNHGLTNISYGKEIYNRSFIISVHISKPWKTNPLGKHRD